MKRSNRSIRRYRDSQAKLIIAKRRYQDALRRYRDAEGEEKVSKFKALKAKIDEKFAMYAKDHPEAIKFYKKYVILTTRINAAIGSSFGLLSAGGSLRALIIAKGNAEELKKLGMTIGGAIGGLIVGLSAVVLSFIGWMKAREAEKQMKQAEQA